MPPIKALPPTSPNFALHMKCDDVESRACHQLGKKAQHNFIGQF